MKYKIGINTTTFELYVFGHFDANINKFNVRK